MTDLQNRASVEQIQNQEAFDSRERIDEIVDDWYLKLGPNANMVACRDRLAVNAVDLYMLATGMEEEMDSMSQKEKGDYFMSLKTRTVGGDSEVFLSPKDGLMSGVLTLELARTTEKPGLRKQLFENANNIFVSVTKDPRFDDKSFGGESKIEAFKYIFDIRLEQICEQLSSGEISYQKAEELFTETAALQTEKFIAMLPDKQLRDGEIYEHYVEILTNFIIWQDQEIGEWSTRAATPREDSPSPELGRDGYAFATDLYISVVDSEKEAPVQVKLVEEDRRNRYNEAIFVYTADSHTYDIRSHMKKVVTAIDSSYKFAESDEQIELLGAESKYLKQHLLNAALESIR